MTTQLGKYGMVKHAVCSQRDAYGAREKKLLGVRAVNVYAVGFYVDQQALASKFKTKFGRKTSAELQDDQSLCDDIIAADDIEKTVRIVVTSGMINHNRFLGGLKESLQPACKREGDLESMQQFEQLFEGANFRKGMEIAFTSTKTGGLAARIDNRDVGEVPSPSFTRAFIGLYLGAESVTPKGKASISAGLADLLTSTSGEA